MEVENLTSCPGCASTQITRLDSITDAPAGVPPLEIWRCLSCRVAFLNPRIVGSENDVGDVDAYRADVLARGLVGAGGALCGAALEAHYPELCDLAGRVYDGSTVVDVGCGLGMSTAALVSRGIRARGIDTNARMIEAGRRLTGLDLQLGTVADLAGFHHLITLNSVLEHVPDAVGFLRLLRARTHFLVVTVPNLVDLAYIERGCSYGIQMNSGHLWYFEESTLGRMLERAGFHPLAFYRPEFELGGHLGRGMRFVREYLHVRDNLYGGIGVLAE